MPSSPFLYLSTNLMVADLAKSITLDPVKRKSTEASQNADQAQKYFLEEGTKVTEIVLPPRGMSGRLNMIADSANGQVQFPFMMVHAGDELFRVQRENQLSLGQRALLKVVKTSLFQSSQVSQDRLRSSSADTMADPNTPSNDASILSDEDFKSTAAGAFLMKAFQKQSELHETIVKPKAAGVVVELKKKAFESLQDNKITRKDLKIEVFFNGELADCVMVPERDGCDSEDLKILFTGRRTEYQVERPWVVVPHVQEPDGTIKQFTKSKTKATSLQEQWGEIAIALLNEAFLRREEEPDNEPPSSNYLAAVSQLEMPEKLNDLHKPGNRKMGIIDVVVTMGVGKKKGPETRYICEPERMIHKKAVISPSEQIEPPLKRTRLSSRQNVEADTAGTLPRNRVTSETPSVTRSASPDPQVVVIGRTRWQPQVLAANLKIKPFNFPTPRTPDSPLQSPTKRLASSSPEQIMRAPTLQPATATSFGLASNPFVTAPSIPPTFQTNPTTPLSSFPTGPSPIQTFSSGESLTSPTLCTEGRTRSKRKADVLSPTPSSQSKGKNQWPPIWVTPALSQDCVITYAEVGSGITGVEKGLNAAQNDKASVFRQIKSTRPGFFDEEDVQAGIRFIIL